MTHDRMLAEGIAEEQVEAWRRRHANTPRRNAYWTIDAREADHAEALDMNGTPHAD